MTLKPKSPRVRLERDAYDQLRRQVLERDGWRCQHCGRRTNLEVHHFRHRSQQGDDAEDNLITVCSECHRQRHSSDIGTSGEKQVTCAVRPREHER